MNNKAVNNIASAINEIIIPKFDLYYDDRQNDSSIQTKINNKIKEIEEIEDIVSEIESNVTFEVGDSITLEGHYFYYSSEKEEMVLSGSKKENAKSIILNAEGLYNIWNTREHLRHRILAIVSGLGDVTFEDALKLVEDQIDFKEFIIPRN